MSSNVGLSTPRGSGTSGYVQRNLSLLKPRAAGAGQPYSLDNSARPPRVRKPDQDILKHDKLREIEVKVAELRDKLEDEGKADDDEIDEKCDALRDKLVADLNKGRDTGKRSGAKAKSYQVHELAEAKAKESEKLRKALGLKGEVAEDRNGDSEHPMARQERRKREAEIARMKQEEEHNTADPKPGTRDNVSRRYSDD